MGLSSMKSVTKNTNASFKVSKKVAEMIRQMATTCVKNKEALGKDDAEEMLGGLEECKQLLPPRPAGAKRQQELDAEELKAVDEWREAGKSNVNMMEGALNWIGDALVINSSGLEGTINVEASGGMQLSVTVLGVQNTVARGSQVDGVELPHYQ